MNAYEREREVDVSGSDLFFDETQNLLRIAFGPLQLRALATERA